MNAILKSKQDAARIALAGIELPNDWRKSRAEEAQNWLLQNGLASRRDHFWSYTDPSKREGEVAASKAELPEFEGTALTLGLNFENDAIRIHPLEDVQDALFGDIVARSHEKGQRPYAELVMSHPQGLLIEVSGDAGVLRLDHLNWAGNFIRIEMKAGAKLTLVETFPQATQVTNVIEANLADGAELDHLRIAPQMDDRLHLHLFADLADRADLRSFSLIAPSQFRRFESVVNLNGEGGHVSIAGANLLNGAAFHDDTVYVTHNAVDCTSRQVFKRVIGKDAQSIFQGKIFVEEGAQKTDGYQISQGLMLEDGGEALSKPELEIYADDVACSHGSTTSGLDETALFYLRSRGVPKEMAEKLLVRAFIEEAFEEIRNDELRAQLQALAEEWIFGYAL